MKYKTLQSKMNVDECALYFGCTFDEFIQSEFSKLTEDEMIVIDEKRTLYFNDVSHKKINFKINYYLKNFKN